MRASFEISLVGKQRIETESFFQNSAHRHRFQWGNAAPKKWLFIPDHRNFHYFKVFISRRLKVFVWAAVLRDTHG